MADILKRIRDRNRNEALLRTPKQVSSLNSVSTASTKKVDYGNQNQEGEDTASKLLLLEEESVALSSIRGGLEEKDLKWYDGLNGGAKMRDEASRTEAFLMEQLEITREETNKAQANSLILQQQLQSLQAELQAVKEMLSVSNKNVEESEKVLQRVQDASLEIVRTRSEMVLIKQQAAAAALKAEAFEKNAQTSARAAQDAVAIQTMKKTRIVHGELERAKKVEADFRKKADEGRKLLEEEQVLLDKVREIERSKREEADVEQARYSKLKSYADILVMNAQTASVASAEANEKLAFLLANEKKAQDTLTKYREHAKEVILKSKKFEAKYLNGKRDAETLQTINEIHAYETETATVLLQTMKLIEKLHEKIDKALQRAKDAEASASQKAKDAQESQNTLLDYEEVLKKALSESMASLRDLRDEEAKFEKIRSDSVRYDDELERAVTEVRIKSAATVESEDEARKALRELQNVGGPKVTGTTSEDIDTIEEDGEELEGGKRPEKNGVFSKVAEALKNLKKKNVTASNNLVKQVSEEMSNKVRVHLQ